jgi:hypothetical protein
MRLVTVDADYEQRRAELERRFPGWQIWASGPTWCARPWPLINAASPEELAERIRAAHLAPPIGSPSLASWGAVNERVIGRKRALPVKATGGALTGGTASRCEHGACAAQLG